MSASNKTIQGSSKDIIIEDSGMFFEFSDRYSVYDWGEMPDLIQNKGSNLREMAIFFFERLSSKGIKTHYQGESAERIKVKSFPVIRPVQAPQGYDYSPLRECEGARLIPLEVIFRFGVPKGSSLLKAQTERLKELGLEKAFEGQRFDRPLVEFSTKLEPTDRMLDIKEALEISSLDQEQFSKLEKIAGQIALELKQIFDSVFEGGELELWDGKFEFAIDESSEIVLIDTIGVDELRLTLNGAPLSKELLRQFYAHSEWKRELLARKSKSDWKRQMLSEGIVPSKLPVEALNVASSLYSLLKDVLVHGKGQEKLKELSQKISSYLTPKNVLIVGDGGREHSLALKFTESPQVKKVFIQSAKGDIFGKSAISSADIKTQQEIVEFSKQNNIDLVFIGPEKPLVEGLADTLREASIPVFGPGAKGARLEASKDFSKQLMQTAGIPTASYGAFAEFDQAVSFIEKASWKDGYVVKVDGLAAGKGVIVCDDKEQTLAALKELMIDNTLQQKTSKVIIEERLIGREVSLFAIFDSSGWRPLSSACDYKRIRDNDEGPNTGGMGAYSPADWIDPEEMNKIQDLIFPSLHKAMGERGIEYQGVVFAGVMMTSRGPKVLEFNARLGDPETQCLLPRVQNDIFDLFMACSKNKISSVEEIRFSQDCVAHVVAAAAGYPGTEGEKVRKGDEVLFTGPLEDCWSVFAGVRAYGDKYLTCGGRVLGVSAMAPNRKLAREKAYKGLKNIHFEGMQYRHDIAK